MQRLSGTVILIAAGCAKHSAPSAGYLEEAASYGGAPYPMEVAADEAEMSYAPAAKSAGPAPGARAVAAMPPPPPAPPPSAEPTEPAPPAQAEAAQAERMVHYAGWARLRATQVSAAIDQAKAIALAAGGRVESLSSDAITVRVPVAQFDAAWRTLLALGDVMDRSVTAEDVTDAFLAVDLRVKTLTVTRDRLMALLAKAETEEEKLALLRELQRVTEQLDSFERQLRTLRGLADFSRISLEFVPREAFANAAAGPDVTGFGWIGALSPFRRDVGAEGKRIALPVPEGLVVLSPKGAYVAESPEGAAIWTGTLPNDPRADAAFWIAAVHERLGDDFAKAETRAVGTWQCLTLTDGGEAPYVWEVCVQVDAADKTLWLGEVYYPSLEAQQRYAPAIAAALTGGAS